MHAFVVALAREDGAAGGAPAALAALLGPDHPSAVRAAAAAAIASAAARAPAFASSLVAADAGAVEALRRVAQQSRGSVREALQGFAGLSAVLRTSRAARAAFYADGGWDHLAAIVSAGGGGGGGAKAKPRGGGGAARLQEAAQLLLSALLEIALDADAADAGSDAAADAVGAMPAAEVPQFARAALALLAHARGGGTTELGAQETALVALRAVEEHHDDGAAVLRQVGADRALQRALLRLGGSMHDIGDAARAAAEARQLEEEEEERGQQEDDAAGGRTPQESLGSDDGEGGDDGEDDDGGDGGGDVSGIMDILSSKGGHSVVAGGPNDGEGGDGISAGAPLDPEQAALRARGEEEDHRRYAASLCADVLEAVLVGHRAGDGDGDEHDEL